MPGEASVVTDTADTRRQYFFSASPKLYILLLRDLNPRDVRGKEGIQEEGKESG